jgi:hypothetical protein
MEQSVITRSYIVAQLRVPQGMQQRARNTILTAEQILSFQNPTMAPHQPYEPTRTERIELWTAMSEWCMRNLAELTNTSNPALGATGGASAT